MKYLLIKLRYIGDSLLTTPVAKVIKRSSKDSYIAFLVNKGTEELLYFNPWIDRIYTFNKESSLKAKISLIKHIRKEMFDVCIDFTSSDRGAFLAFLSGAKLRIGFCGGSLLRDKLLYTSAKRPPAANMHQIEKNLYLLNELGIKSCIQKPEIFLKEEELERGKALLIGSGWDGQTPYIIFHPGSRRWYKSWPAENFALLGDLVKNNFIIDVVICGGRDDTVMAEYIAKMMRERSINIAGKTSIRELASIIKGASLFIGNDSAPMHISYSLDVPTIALFGPTDWESWYPVGNNHSIFSKDVPCRPCGHSRDCDKGEMNCMRLISVEEVFSKVCEYLADFRIRS